MLQNYFIFNLLFSENVVFSINNIFHTYKQLALFSQSQQHLLWGWHENIAYQTPLSMPAPPHVMCCGTVEMIIHSLLSSLPLTLLYRYIIVKSNTYN